MSRPPERTLGETDLQPPRRPGHVNPGPDTRDPPRAGAELVRAADRVLGAAQLYVAGDLPFDDLRVLVERYGRTAAGALERGEI